MSDNIQMENEVVAVREFWKKGAVKLMGGRAVVEWQN